jgi:hypothetical protein
MSDSSDQGSSKKGPEAPDPFGFSELKRDELRWLMSKLFAGGGGGRSLNQQLRDWIVATVLRDDKKTYRFVERSKARQLQFLEALRMQGLLSTDRLPEWARTPASVRDMLKASPEPPADTILLRQIQADLEAQGHRFPCEVAPRASVNPGKS